MTDRTKKILFAVVFSVVSLGLGFGLYLFFFRPLFTPQVAVTPTPTEQVPGALPQAGTGGAPNVVTPTGPGGLPSSGQVTPPTTPQPTGVTLLMDSVTQSAAPTPDGRGARFYNPEDGKFYKVNADGSTSALGDKSFPGVQKVDWGNKSEQAVLEYPDGSNILYDFDTRRQVTLPKHWGEFDFAPDDTHIVAKSLGLDPSNRFLVISDPNGNEAKAVASLGENQQLTKISWSPNNQVIGFAMTGKPQPDGAEEVYLIGENHENFKSLVVPGRGFQPNWSPTGRQILYSVYHERDELRPSLWVTGGAGDSIGDNRRNLNLNTWADKCAWTGETELLCGVPQALDPGSGLAEDRFSTGPDDVYRVDLRSGVSTKISTAEQVHPIRNPIVSQDKKKLIFTDAATGRLYSYDIK